MKQYNPLEYIMISAANAYGLDKESWDTRIDWFKDNWPIMNTMVRDASEPILMRKAMFAYEDAVYDIPTGYLMNLDATASGLQIMACLIGCEKTASAVNLIDTGKREDVYTEVANEMGKDRKTLKHPVMT